MKERGFEIIQKSSLITYTVGPCIVRILKILALCANCITYSYNCLKILGKTVLLRVLYKHFAYQYFCQEYIIAHSSEIRGLRSTKCSSETLQNLLYFLYKKTHVVFFISCNFIFLPYECPGLCRHRPGHS